MSFLRIPAVAALLVGASLGYAADGREVRGRILDQRGNPAANVDVSYYWTANGPLNDKEGKPFDVSTPEGRRNVRNNLGKMESLGDCPTKTGADGRFLLQVHNHFHAVMAIDRNKGLGGLVILSKGNEAVDVEIGLRALVRVKCALELPRAGQPSIWSNIYMLLPDDPTRPLDVTRLVGCNSLDARFEMSLPPGRYLLNAYTFNRDGTELAEMVPDKEVVLTGKTPEANLGMLRLSLFKPRVQGRIKRAHEEHRAQRNRFEILAICLEPDGEITSIADLDKQLKPFVDHAWRQQLPSPVLLDPTFTTWERYGLPAWGVAILIDPEGNMIKGDEAVLAEMLKQR